MGRMATMLLRYALIGAVPMVSANSCIKTGPPCLSCHSYVSSRQGDTTNILETESITFFDGDSSFVAASNGERHGFFLCLSGGHESFLKEKEGSTDSDSDDSEDDDDNGDDSGDDGANKMLSNVSVRRCLIAAVKGHYSRATPASSSILVVGPEPVADVAKMMNNNHLAIPTEICRKQRLRLAKPSFPPFVAEILLKIRGGESATVPSSSTLDNEFSRRLLVAAFVTLLYEAIIGHILEFLKIVMQTSPPGTSYAQVFGKITGGTKGLAGIYDGFLPWGVVQALFKGGVFGFAHAIAYSYIEPLMEKGSVSKQLALTLAGGIAGGFQGYVLSPILLLKTRVMTNERFRGNATDNLTILKTILLSFRIGFDIIASEGVFALMKGSNVFALKRVCDWSTRYYFSAMFMNMLKYFAKTSAPTKIEMFLADMLGGTASTLVTLPLDVIVAKTQDAKKAGKNFTPWSLLYHDYTVGGWRRLLGSQMQGFEARLLTVCLTTVAMKTGATIMYDLLYHQK